MGASDAKTFYEVFPLCIWQQMFGSYFRVDNWRSCFVREDKQHGASEVQFRCELQLETKISQHYPTQSSAQGADLIISPMKDIYVED